MRNYLKIRRHGFEREQFFFFDDQDPEDIAKARRWLETMAPEIDKGCKPPAFRFASIWEPLAQWPDVQYVGEFRRRQHDPFAW